MKRFVLIAIFATSFVLCGCSDDPDPDITSLQSDLDEKFDALQGEIETLKQDINTLAAETKTPLNDGQIPPDDHRDPAVITAKTKGLPPSGNPTGEPIVRDGLPPGVVLHEGIPVMGGGQIVFAVHLPYQENNHAVSIMNSNGTGLRVIAMRDEPIYNPAISPADGRIAYTVRRERGWLTYLLHPGGSTQLSGGDVLFPAWSFAGKQIAYIRNGDIYISPVKSKLNHRQDDDLQLTFEAFEASNEPPTWSPSGRQIAFTSGMDGNDNIFVIDVDGSNRIQITNNPADDRHPDWSPNGDSIAFQSHRNGSWDIYTVNTKTVVETQLTHSPSDFREPSWSPDGTKLALCETPVGEIYVMNADGTGLMNITNSGTYETSPDW